ncbi:hypothetical protein UCDDA912_g09610 [Diaporthe ampelina]|uniref:Uncharacterized protein n=1 Tax=Diaporthe ampelina TaxID=1214573 RepID=A0A0G2F6W9_9PEZI|nr:hypothetical protein UCDDA912_g09610 [Diaporthe ampelina]
MKPSTLLLSILPLALAAPLAEPEPVADIEARQKYGSYGDKSGGYGNYYGAYKKDLTDVLAAAAYYLE